MDPERGVASVPGVPGRRASTLPAAALVMERVLKHVKPGRILFSSLGVREGWLHELLDEKTRALDPLLDGCRQLAAETARVPDFAAALERWTDELFMGESLEQRRLRVAATLLSDIAWREARDVQARHVFERILRFPFIGITHPERVFLAAAVHARHGARAEHDALALLSSDEAERAHVLGTALLLGHPLLRQRPGDPRSREPRRRRRHRDPRRRRGDERAGQRGGEGAAVAPREGDGAGEDRGRRPAWEARVRGDRTRRYDATARTREMIE